MGFCPRRHQQTNRAMPARRRPCGSTRTRWTPRWLIFFFRFFISVFLPFHISSIEIYFFYPISEFFLKKIFQFWNLTQFRKKIVFFSVFFGFFSILKFDPILNFFKNVFWVFFANGWFYYVLPWNFFWFFLVFSFSTFQCGPVCWARRRWSVPVNSCARCATSAAPNTWATWRFPTFSAPASSVYFPSLPFASPWTPSRTTNACPPPRRSVPSALPTTSPAPTSTSFPPPPPLKYATSTPAYLQAKHDQSNTIPHFRWIMAQ